MGYAGPGSSLETVSVWVVEDSTDYRQTVRELLSDEDGLECSQDFESAEALFAHLNDHFAPSVILLDIGLPGMSGIEAASRLKVVSPATHLIMLTVHEENDRIFEALCAGATGYLLKSASPDDLIRSIREVLAGGAAMTPQIARRVLNMFTQVKAPRWDYGLTDRELDVLRELTNGKSKQKIAKDLFLSFHTVDTHLRNIYAKLHVRSKSGAVAKALKERLVEEG